MIGCIGRDQRFAPAVVAVLAVWLILLSRVGLVAAAAPTDLMAVEGPVAAEFAVSTADQLPVVATAPVDIAAMRAEDEIREMTGLPPRFALPHEIRLTPEDSGTWEDLNDHYQMWRTRISAPGAVSLNLGFSGYRLPRGARLSIYPADVTGPSDDRGMVTFTDRDNEDHGELWTPVILADEIVVELVLPRGERHNYRLDLTAINQGYRYFGDESTALGREKSGSCNIDVVCTEGDDWRREIGSVGVISTGGSTYCTGVMLNNTAQDGTPYFLTANHCGITTYSAASLVVYWNFQSPECGDQGGGSLNQFMTGSTFLAASTTSDFTLVELDDPVDPAHNISFAGWDNTTANPTSATAIHHPSTDEKSISFEFDPTTTSSYLDNPAADPLAYIKVTDWDVGTTEPGSSGSPLFDQNHHVVGQLHGGYAACGNDAPDWYGRLSVSWAWLASYLDPLHTGQTSIDTYAPALFGLFADGATLNGQGDAGGPFTPSGTEYMLTNFGPEPVEYLVVAGVDWVTVGGGAGTLAGGAETSVVVDYSAAADMLPSGVYAGSIYLLDLTVGEVRSAEPVRLRVGVPELVHRFDLNSDPGWHMSGDWGYGAPLGGGGERGNFDPTAGYSGSAVLGFNLAGDYATDLAETHLVTTAIDCTELSATSLRFWRWLNVEHPAYDHAAISVSTDNVTFTPIWANESEITDSAWVEVDYDISAVADSQGTVYVRWTMGTTNDYLRFAGWNLDDIEIWGVRQAVAATGDLPAYKLSVGSYPNPFNPATRIEYVLAREGQTRVRVYDLHGRLVRELIDGVLPAGPGSVVWRGDDDGGMKVSSGVYFVQVSAAGQRVDHKVVLLK